MVRKLSLWGWRDYLVLVIVVLMLVTTAVLLSWDFVPWKRIFEHQGMAAWVQAVGSIVALVIAIAVPAKQHAADKEERRQQDFARRQATERAAMLAIWTARSHVEHVVEANHSEAGTREFARLYRPETYAEILDMLRTIPLTELTLSQVSVMIYVRNMFATFSATVAHGVNDVRSNPHKPYHLGFAEPQVEFQRAARAFRASMTTEPPPEAEVAVPEGAKQPAQNRAK